MNRKLILAACATFAVAAPAHAQLPGGLPDLTVTAKHDTEPVVLKGSNFGTWSVPANQTVQPPLMDLVDCPPGTDTNACSHNEYADPAVDTASDSVQGAPVNQLVGYHWDLAAARFVQIPFQVDEAFTRYLSNEASGFSIYSGQDQHTTYAYDREGFRYTKSDPADPCKAVAASPAMKDPVKGLDSNDEVAFMASDAGPKAPAGAIRPAGIDRVKEITVLDPPTRAAREAPSTAAPARATGGGGRSGGGRPALRGEMGGPGRATGERGGEAAARTLTRRGPFCRPGGDQKPCRRVRVTPPLDGIYAQW